MVATTLHFHKVVVPSIGRLVHGREKRSLFLSSQRTSKNKRPPPLGAKVYVILFLEIEILNVLNEITLVFM